MERTSGTSRKNTVSKNTGIASVKALAESAPAPRCLPNRPRNTATTRSAAPLAAIAMPMIAASAMMTPMPPAVSPNACATRGTFSAHSPGASRLTTRAAVISDRNACSLSTMMPPITIASPTARTRNGYPVLIPPAPGISSRLTWRREAWMILYRTAAGPVLAKGDRLLAIARDWHELVNDDALHDSLLRHCRETRDHDPALADHVRRPLPPIGERQELWAAGVTWYRSRTARM